MSTPSGYLPAHRHKVRKGRPAMPATGKPGNSAVARLQRLPRQPSMVVEGGKRATELSVQEGKQVVQPEIALWLIAERGTVLGFRLIMPDGGSDDGTGDAVAALVDALSTPLPASGLDEPVLPGKIVVDDAPLAQALGEVFTPLDVAVEEVEELPLFDHVLEEMQEVLGGGQPEPFSWEVNPA